jgi:MFS family permease
VREPLRHRPFRQLFLAQCASFLGDSIFLIALTFATLEVAGRASALGLVLGSGSLLLVLSFLVSGVWADRLPRVRVMIASDLVRLLSQALLAVLLITDRAELWHLIALNGVYSIATAFFTPARTGLTPQLLEPRLLVSGNGVMATAENLMWTLGWAFGGILVATIGVGWAIAIDSLTFGVSALLLRSIGRIDRPVQTAERAPFLRELAAGFSEVRSRRWLWFVIVNATLFLLVYEAPMQIVGPITMDRLYDGSRSWGYVLSAMAAGSMIGALLSAMNKLRRPMLVSLCLFFATAVVPLLLLVEAPLAVIAAGNLLVGMGFGLFDTIWNSTVQHRVPADRLSRVSAWDWMGSMAGMPIGFAVAGVLVEHVGRGPTLIGMSICTLVVSIVFIADREVRSLGDELTALHRSGVDTSNSAPPGA